MMYNIPRIVIAATQSGSGKTTLVTGLLGALRSMGLKFQSYKIGPDYIDPGYHALASGRPAHNLDSWLLPKERIKKLFAETAKTSDIAVIEGVMGLYDGGRKGVSSTAEIAKLLNAPVLLVIDSKSMGASAAAIALGFRAYDPEVKLAGVLLNRLGSSTHEAMIREALEKINIPVFGAMRRDDSLAMPERHLGLLPTEENQDRELINRIAEAVGKQIDLKAVLALAQGTEPMEIVTEPPAGSATFKPKDTEKCRIAVARDEAFSFYYPESLKVLEQYGAEIITFSPLNDASIPAADGLILGGGFPEMFAEDLERNFSMRQSIRDAAHAGMPIYGECGGFMYLTEGLTDFEGQFHEMTGVIPGRVQMKKKLQMVGYVEAKLLADSLLGPAGQRLRGHEFHFSAELPNELGSEYPRAFEFTRMRNGEKYPAGYSKKNVLGSYLHLHFAGCEDAAKCFTDACKKYSAASKQLG